MSSVWANSQLCREAEETRARREEVLRREHDALRSQNLKKWARHGLSTGRAVDYGGELERDSRLPKMSTHSRAAMLALLELREFSTPKVVLSQMGADMPTQRMRDVLRHLVERGLVDCGEFRNPKNQLQLRYRLSPRGKDLVK